MRSRWRGASDLIRTDDVSYATPPSFNFGALGVIAILVALYTVFW
jgi:SSS family solute:Na+ symporter